jgi:choline kinase
MTQALILAAGIGRRFGQTPAGVAKCMLKIGNQTLLEHQLGQLQRMGIEQIGVVVGHAADSIRALIGNACSYFMNPRYQETDSLYSLWLAREWINGPFILLNGDVIAHPQIYQLLQGAEACTLLYDSRSGHQEEHMKVKLNGPQLLELGKHLPTKESHGENVGMIKFNQAGAAKLFQAANCLVADGGDRMWAVAAVNQVAEQVGIRCVDIAGLPWAEIDFPEDLIYAQARIWPLLS